MRQAAGVYTTPHSHWVGDGFPVRSVFSYQSHVGQLSPFLPLDYAGPHTFTSDNEKRSVGEHPHRGFETITIVYGGEVGHHDSTGRSGIVGPGDVQWMTVGAGILHEELHSPEFTRQGGGLEIVQLWVNLPTGDRMAIPGYQSISSDVIPTVTLPGEIGSVRVIAGSYQDTKGPTHTFSPLNAWDICLQRNHQLTLSQPEGWSIILVVLKGNITVNDTTSTNGAQLMVLSQQGKTLHIEVSSNASVLPLPGESLNEPIVGCGPFIMNTKQEIVETVHDFNSGHLDQI